MYGKEKNTKEGNKGEVNARIERRNKVCKEGGKEMEGERRKNGRDGLSKE